MAHDRQLVRAPLAAARDLAAHSRPLRILLAEDDADCAMAIAMYLRMKGYDVDTAGSVGEAVTKAEARPELLISDLDLPDGNGRDLLATLRRVRPIAALAVSGHGSSEDIRKSKQAGFVEHLVKPIEMPALLKAIARVTGRDGPNGRSAAPGV